jgi:hypothetical protein
MIDPSSSGNSLCLYNSKQLSVGASKSKGPLYDKIVFIFRLVNKSTVNKFPFRSCHMRHGIGAYDGPPRIRRMLELQRETLLKHCSLASYKTFFFFFYPCEEIHEQQIVCQIVVKLDLLKEVCSE